MTIMTEASIGCGITYLSKYDGWYKSINCWRCQIKWLLKLDDTKLQQPIPINSTFKDAHNYHVSISSIYF